MSTIRQNILEAIKLRLENEMPILEQVEINRITPVDLATASLPCAFLYSDSESRVTEPEIGSEEWRWLVGIEIWVNDFDIEEVIPLVHNVMATDETFGGLVHWTRRMSATPFVLGSADNQHGISISYEVQYSHDFGAM